MKNTTINIKALPILALMCGLSGCGLFSSAAGDTEVVFAATEVGTPEGDKIAKDIGPAGGTLVSPDGRLALTVPPTVLTETLPFSIQPITNKADGGLGLAYRLEPDGKTFASPLQISIRYDEKELEGTMPEALTLAYQNPQGGWHLQEGTLDQNTKTVTVMTTHFTDWSFLKRLRISPETATVRVGETVKLTLTPCYYQRGGLLGRFRRLTAGGNQRHCEVTDGKRIWSFRAEWYADMGTVTPPRSELTVTYTAPSEKPNPNVATVSLPYELHDYVDGGDGWFDQRPERSKRGVFIARITIVDGSYRATGSDGPTSYSGTICSLTMPFTVIGKNGPLTYTLEFSPSMDGRSGKSSMKGFYAGGSWSGSGNYTVEGFDTDNPRLLVQASSTLQGGGKSASGTGVGHIDLVRNDGNECNSE